MNVIEYLLRTIHAMGADTATAAICALACVGAFFVLDGIDQFLKTREERYQDRMIEYAKSDAQWSNELFIPLYRVEEDARRKKAALQNEARWDDPYFIDIVKGFDRDDS